MNKILAIFCAFLIITPSLVEAANRKGSHYVGGHK